MVPDPMIPDGKQMHSKEGLLRMPTLMNTIMEPEKDYKPFNRLEMGVSEWPEESKYKKMVRYKSGSKEYCDGHGKDDHFYKVWPHGIQPDDAPPHMTESMNYGGRRKAHDTMQLHQDMSCGNVDEKMVPLTQLKK
jgi:hypothetical protein